MRVIVAVNCISELDHRQTTSLLIASLVRAGRDVHLAGVRDFSISGTAASNRHLVNSAQISLTTSGIGSS